VRAAGDEAAGVRIAALLVPSSCLACGARARSDSPLCGRCQTALEAAPPVRGPAPPRLDSVWSASPNDGVARRLVTALKFRSLLPAAEVIAECLARAPVAGDGLPVVPVPASPSRQRRRGFDPAGEIARLLAERSCAPLVPCLRRGRGPRQVGRSRVQRVARPPDVRAAGVAPEQVLLVDDVVTTGATLSACAAALRRAGCRRVAAVSFVREL
jgi:predicted amidophosphoribosyltransferase